MRRTGVYQYGDTDESMAAAKVDGVRVKFDTEKTPYVSEPARQRAENELADTIFKQQPPYAPRASKEEQVELAKWIIHTRASLRQIETDPFYKFASIVAGAAGVRLESLISFAPGYNLPSQSAVEAVVDNGQIIDPDLEALYEERRRRATTLAEQRQRDKNANQDSMNFAFFRSMTRELPGTPGRYAPRRVPPYPVIESRSVGVALDADAALVPQKRAGTTDAQYQDDVDLHHRQLANSVFWEFDTRSREYLQKYKDGDDDDVTRRYASRISGIAPVMPIKSMWATDANTPKSQQSIEYEMKLEDIDKQIAASRPAQTRARQLAQMEWSLRGEVLGELRMHPDFYSILRFATARVRLRVPSLSGVPNFEVFTNTEDCPDDAVVLFASVVVHEGNENHFFAPRRDVLDSNLDRLYKSENSVLYALGKFAYVNGRIVRTGTSSLAGGVPIQCYDAFLA